MYHIDCIERVIVDDGGCGGGTTVYCLQVLVTFIAGDDNNWSHVQSTEDGRHDVDCTGGDHRGLIDNDHIKLV